MLYTLVNEYTGEIVTIEAKTIDEALDVLNSHQE